MSILEAKRLRKLFGRHVAVDDVSFEVESGEVLGLLGPNGAGKSTVMLMLAGLLRPNSGTVMIHGQELNPGSRKHKYQLGVTPQELAIYPELSALENLKFFGRLYGLHGRDLERRCREVLELLGLADRTEEPTQNFSGGMKRRLNFGVSILHRPSLLILDEPTVGVDPQSRAHLLDCVRELTHTGVSVIYASHYMDEVQAICRRVVILDQGQMLASDTVAELLSRTPSGVFLKVDDVTKLNGHLDGLATTSVNDGQQLVFVSGDVAEVDQRLPLVLEELRKASVQVQHIETQHPNLEHLFLQMTGRQLRD